MAKISEHINNAYKYLSRIPVTDEAVDLMALARQELRLAHKLAVELDADKPTEVADG